MSKECYICGKKPLYGKTFTMKGIPKKKGGIGLHCTGWAKRRFLPNLQNVKIMVNNGVKKASVCTCCIQKGLIQKAA